MIVICCEKSNQNLHTIFKDLCACLRSGSYFSHPGVPEAFLFSGKHDIDSDMWEKKENKSAQVSYNT